MELVKVTMESIPMWISLLNLSFNLWNKEALSIICCVLGKPLFSNRYTMKKEKLSFSRVCVERDARRDFKDHIILYLEDGMRFI